MQICCELEVDVNGEEIFVVDKKILASFSGRLDKFVNKLTGKCRSLKVIFHDFPGGAEGFELIVKYCYNRGKIDITPSNVLLLHFAANFMEMNEDHHGASSLIDQTKKYLERVHCFTWPELLYCLKQCQKLLPVLNDSRILQQILDCLVERVVLPSVPSCRPSTSSSDSSCIEFSGDISIDSTGSYNSQTSWWSRDLHFLSIQLLEKVVETMISQKLDDVMISSFLFYYQRVKFLETSQDEKSKIIETLNNLLYSLDRSFISLKGLLRILQVSSTLKIRGCCINKLESMIGCKLDEASLDDLLVPSRGKSYAYDVNLVRRLLKHFVSDSSKQIFIHRLKKVALLMDLYIVEVAPDPGLKPSKFVVLATGLPDYARDSHDRIYEAIDIYLKVHNNLREEEKIKLCCALNYDKLSAGSLILLAHNANFPGCAADTALVSQQANFRMLNGSKQYREVPSDMPVCYHRKESEIEDQVLYKNALESRRKDKKGIVQVSVEKVFRKMQTSKTHISETRLCSLTKGKSLPTLCR